MKLNPASWFSPKDEYSIGDDAVLRAFYGTLANVAASGVRVDQETALRCIAVLACLIVRAETFGALPPHVLRRQGAEQIHDTDNPAYRVLAIAPNPLLPAGDLWRWKQLTEDRTGNAYMRVKWSGYDVSELWPMTGTPPRLVIDDGSAVYRYHGDDFTPANTYPLREVLHFKGPILKTPYEGKSLIDLASEAIGVTIASEQFFARLLGNGTHFPGYLEYDKPLTGEDRKALRKSIEETSGLGEAGRMRIFDRGLKFKQNEMTLKDAQLTEQMRWQLQQIASVFRMPLAMLQDLTHGTYTNSEQQDLWLAKHTMTPICVRTEDTVRHRLLERRPQIRLKFNLDGLLRGDYKTRTEGDSTLVRAGIIDRNEARSHYDLNPRPGLELPLAEMNLGTVGADGTITGPAQGARAEGEPGGSPVVPAAGSVLEPLLRDAAETIRRRRRSDQHRGKDRAETVAFATAKLAPIAEAAERAGVTFDPGTFIDLALAGDAPATLAQEE